MCTCDGGDDVCTCDDGGDVCTCDGGDDVCTCDDGGDVCTCDGGYDVCTCDGGGHVCTCDGGVIPPLMSKSCDSRLPILLQLLIYVGLDMKMTCTIYCVNNVNGLRNICH